MPSPSVSGSLRFVPDPLIGEGSDRVKRDHRLALGLQFGVKRLNDQHFSALKRRVLYGCNDVADYSRDLHWFGYLMKSIVSMTPMIAESTGQSLFPSAIRADEPPTTITFS